MPAIQRWPVLVARGFRLHQTYRRTLFATQCLIRPIRQYGYATKTTKTAIKKTTVKKKSESLKKETTKRALKKTDVIVKIPAEQPSAKPKVILSSMKDPFHYHCLGTVINDHYHG